MFRRAFAPVMALFLLVGVAVPAHAQNFPQEPKAFVEGVINYAINDIITPSIPKDQQIVRFATLIDNAFDIPFVARFVAGGYWKSASEPQRTEFLRLFRDMNVYTWAGRFNEYDNQAINVTNLQSQQTRGGTIHEVTTVIGGQKPVVVIWVVRPSTERGGKLGIIDIKVEGVSMLRTFQSDYQAVLKNTGSMDGLNQVLREKTDQLRGAQ